MSFNEPKITNLFSEDYNDDVNFSRTELEIQDEFSVLGSNLHIGDLSDPEQGIFLTGAQGTLRIYDISENKNNKLTAVIPDYVQSGDYSLELIKKDEDGYPLSSIYSKKIHIKDYVETYGVSKEDYWYNQGIKAGKTELGKYLVKWLEENGYTKSEIIKKLVVKK